MSVTQEAGEHVTYEMKRHKSFPKLNHMLFFCLNLRITQTLCVTTRCKGVSEAKGYLMRLNTSKGHMTKHWYVTEMNLIQCVFYMHSNVLHVFLPVKVHWQYVGGQSLIIFQFRCNLVFEANPLTSSFVPVNAPSAPEVQSQDYTAFISSKNSGSFSQVLFSSQMVLHLVPLLAFIIHPNAGFFFNL